MTHTDIHNYLLANGWSDKNSCYVPVYEKDGLKIICEPFAYDGLGYYFQDYKSLPQFLTPQELYNLLTTESE